MFRINRLRQSIAPDHISLLRSSISSCQYFRKLPSINRYYSQSSSYRQCQNPLVTAGALHHQSSLLNRHSASFSTDTERAATAEEIEVAEDTEGEEEAFGEVEEVGEVEDRSPRSCVLSYDVINSLFTVRCDSPLVYQWLMSKDFCWDSTQQLWQYSTNDVWNEREKVVQELIGLLEKFDYTVLVNQKKADNVSADENEALSSVAVADLPTDRQAVLRVSDSRYSLMTPEVNIKTQLPQVYEILKTNGFVWNFKSSSWQAKKQSSDNVVEVIKDRLKQSEFMVATEFVGMEAQILFGNTGNAGNDSLALFTPDINIKIKYPAVHAWLRSLRCTWSSKDTTWVFPAPEATSDNLEHMKGLLEASKFSVFVHSFGIGTKKRNNTQNNSQATGEAQLTIANTIELHTPNINIMSQQPEIYTWLKSTNFAWNRNKLCWEMDCYLDESQELVTIGTKLKELSLVSDIDFSVLPTAPTTTHTPTAGRVLSFDTESADLHGRVLQLGWIIYDQHGQEIKKKCELIVPDGTFKLSPRAFDVHGISLEKAAEEGKAQDVVMAEFLADVSTILHNNGVLIAYNTPYDVKVLKTELEVASPGLVESDMIDFNPRCIDQIFNSALDVMSVHLLRQAFPKQYNSRRYGIKLVELHGLLVNAPNDGDLKFHDALDDAKACANCYFEYVKRGILPPVGQ